MDKIMNCKKCKLCGKECRGVIHEIKPNEYLCDKCFYGKAYREYLKEQYKKEILELQEQIITEYIEWVEGFKI